MLLTRKYPHDMILSFHGGIAQLGERLNGIQEVSGSIPLISTIIIKSLDFSENRGFFVFKNS